MRTSAFGTCAAAGRSMSQVVDRVPVTPAAGCLHDPGAREGEAHRLRLVLARDEEPHVPGRAQGAEGQGHPHGGRLGGAVDTDHRPVLLVQGRVLGEQRCNVRVRADAEHHHVETGHVLPALGALGQLRGIPLGGGLGAAAVRAVRSRDGVDPFGVTPTWPRRASRAWVSLRSGSPVGR